MTEFEKNCLLDYEQLLLTNSTKKISTKYFSQGNAEQMAILLFRYVFIEILHWEPEDFYNYLTPQLLKMMYFMLPYSKLSFSKELVQVRDVFHLASIVYPETRITNDNCLVILMYREALTHRNEKYPKYFFEDGKAEERACLCLRYILISIQKKKQYFNSIKHLYEFFSNRTEAEKFFKNHKLMKASEMYDSPIDFLHDALQDEQKNELFYQYYRFKEMEQKAGIHETIKELYEIIL